MSRRLEYAQNASFKAALPVEMTLYLEKGLPLSAGTDLDLARFRPADTLLGLDLFNLP